jgi:hypothetical protein
MSSIRYSSVFQACKQHGGDYWHGQTVTYYKDGIIEKREHKMILLWSSDKVFDEKLYKTFKSQIEVHQFEKSTQEQEVISDQKQTSSEQTSPAMEQTEPTTTQPTTTQPTTTQPTTTQPTATTTTTQPTTTTTTTQPTTTTTTMTDTNFKNHPFNEKANIRQMQKDAELYRNEKKRERQTYQENIKRKKAKSLEDFHFSNHFLLEDATPSSTHSTNIVAPIPTNSLRSSDTMMCVFTEIGNLITAIEFRDGETYEALLVHTCQNLQEELGHEINFRSFALYDKQTNKQINLNHIMTLDKKELVLKSIKGEYKVESAPLPLSSGALPNHSTHLNNEENSAVERKSDSPKII